MIEKLEKDLLNRGRPTDVSNSPINEPVEFENRDGNTPSESAQPMKPADFLPPYDRRTLAWVNLKMAISTGLVGILSSNSSGPTTSFSRESLPGECSLRPGTR
jgi:hypothetical protein